MHDDADQRNLWRRYSGNHLLLAAHAISEEMGYADMDEDLTADFALRDFCLQEGEARCPSGEAWPEYADNVVPISQYMRRK